MFRYVDSSTLFQSTSGRAGKCGQNLLPQTIVLPLDGKLRQKNIDFSKTNYENVAVSSFLKKA